MIFSASESGREDFVLFNALDGGGALFANVLCDNPILCMSLIGNFGWKQQQHCWSLVFSGGAVKAVDMEHDVYCIANVIVLSLRYFYSFY